MQPTRPPSHARLARRTHPLPRAATTAAGIESCEPRVLLANGFSATYFDNPDLSSPILSRSDPAIDFDFKSDSPVAGVAEGTYSVRWNGSVQPTATGDYLFTLTADDGVRLYVGGRLVIDRWTDRPTLAGDADSNGQVNFNDYQIMESQFGSAGPQADFNADGIVNSTDYKILNANYGKSKNSSTPVSTASVWLQSGLSYDIVLEYYNRDGIGLAKLEWEGPGITRQVVPPGPQSTTNSPVTNGLNATYFSDPDLTEIAHQHVDPRIDFDWTDGAPGYGIDKDFFSVRWEGLLQAPVAGSYSFHLQADDGVRMWIDGQQIIDSWMVAYTYERNTDPIALSGGLHTIKVEYFENDGGANVKLRWDTPTTPYEIVPTQYLFTTATVIPPVDPPPVDPPPVDPPPVDPPPNPTNGPGSLRVSANRRFLERTDGTPFFWMGDTAWRLFYDTNQADADLYLTDRANKEFSVVYATAFNLGFNSLNEYGQGTFLNHDVSQPNDSFFQYVDYVVQKAASLGLYVAFLPAWGESVSYANGRLFNTTTGYNYTKWLANRYKNQSNIIWVLGGDSPGDDGTGQAIAIWRAMAQGLKDGDGGTHLITFHPNGNNGQPPSSSSWFQNDSWLDFNMFESGHTPNSALAYQQTTADYNRTSPVVRPVLDFENNYENIPAGLNPNNPPMTDYDVRKKNYWALFAGAFGATYGNWEVYEFNTQLSSRFPYKKTWQEALNYPGAQQMKHLKHLMQSRPYLTRIPDQSLLTTSVLSGADVIRATRASDGAYAMIYAASGKAFSVNLTKLGGPTVDAWWYNPRTGQATYLARYNNTIASQPFTPPTLGTDWILVLDQVSKNFGTPGSGIAPDTAAPSAATPDTATPDSPLPQTVSPTPAPPSTPNTPAPIPSTPKPILTPTKPTPKPVIPTGKPVIPTGKPIIQEPTAPKPAAPTPAPKLSKPTAPTAPKSTVAKPVTPTLKIQSPKISGSEISNPQISNLKTSNSKISNFEISNPKISNPPLFSLAPLRRDPEKNLARPAVSNLFNPTLIATTKSKALPSLSHRR